MVTVQEEVVHEAVVHEEVVHEEVVRKEFVDEEVVCKEFVDRLDDSCNLRHVRKDVVDSPLAVDDSCNLQHVSGGCNHLVQPVQGREDIVASLA
jgi:hypothetical protein